MVILKMDKERHAKLTPNAIQKFKEKTGKDIFKAPKDQELSLEDIVTLMWACLISEDPLLTVDQIRDMVEFHQIREFLAKIFTPENPT